MLFCKSTSKLFFGSIKDYKSNTKIKYMQISIQEVKSISSTIGNNSFANCFNFTAW